MQNKQFGVLNNGGGHKQNHLCGLHKRIIAVVSSAAILLSTATVLPYGNFNLVREITASAVGTEQQETDVASVTIDGVKSFYATLREAFAAANGKTAEITMLKDAECVSDSGSPLEITYGSVTLDMNGKTLTGYGNGYYGIINVYSGSLSVRGNGKVNVMDIGFSCRGGNLVIADTAFDAVNKGSNYSSSAVQNQGGNITINSGSISGYYSNGQIYHYSGNTIINNIELSEANNKKYRGVHYYAEGKMEIDGGTFANITNRNDSVAKLLGDGYTYKHQDGTWATEAELAGSSISNVTIQKAPLKIEPQGDKAWYYNSGEHSLLMNATPLTDVKTISYEWYNGETKLDCTDGTYPIPKRLPAGKYTYTCKAVCDEYTRSYDFEFEVETCFHAGLEHKPLENNKHGGYCTICSNDVSEEHTWKDGVCSVCQIKAAAEMETGGVTTYYSDIEAAFEAAKGEVSVKLLQDIDLGDSRLTVPYGVTLTLDCGEYTLKSSDNLTIIVDGDFFFTGGTLLNTRSWGCVVRVNGSFTMSGGVINCDSSGEAVTSGYNNSRITITGGSVEGGALIVLSSCTVKLSGGTYSSIDTYKKLADILPEGYALQGSDGLIRRDTGDKKFSNVAVVECPHTGADASANGTGTHSLNCQYCGNTNIENCTYGNEYQHDNTNHWQTCEVCGGKNTQKHNIVAVDMKAPTCTKTGNIEYWKCKDCGTYFSDSECKTEIAFEDTVISATGHSFTNYVSDENATCTKDGTKTAKCDNCDETDTVIDEKSATGHSFTNYVSDENATCIKDGTKTAKCDNCDETDTITDEGTAKGHSFTNYVSDVNATCIKDGTKTAKCDNCDETDTITDEGTAKGHSFTNYVSDENATCIKDGTKTAICDNCNVTDTITDKATGHNLTHINRNEPTSTEKGNIEYWYCENCKKYFSDENCKNEISLSETVIPMITTTVTTAKTTTTTTKATTKATTSTTKTTTKATTSTTKTTTKATTTLITTTVTTSQTTTTKNEIPGDINGDGKTTVSDIVMMQQYLLGVKKLTAKQWKLADMNGDGKVNVFDIIILKRILIKRKI
ncbi:MAG: dockerin type I repeat-containing protein [Clostridium sp.]|nr:dockerin type I repeat-containing protein [Clostridium sp.]